MLQRRVSASWPGCLFLHIKSDLGSNSTPGGNTGLQCTGSTIAGSAGDHKHEHIHEHVDDLHNEHFYLDNDHKHDNNDHNDDVRGIGRRLLLWESACSIWDQCGDQSLN